MTREEVEANVKQLIESDKGWIWGQVQKALDSGGIDLNKYEGRMEWAKIILAAVYGDLEWEYTQKKEWKKDIKNLKILI
jgi:hypothetical protein